MRFYFLHSTITLILALLVDAQHGYAQGTPADHALFRYDGLDYLVSDLSPKQRQALYEAELEYYRKQQKVIDEALFELYVEEEAKRAGQGIEEVAARLLSVEQPEEKSMRAFYEANKQRIPYPYEEVRGQIEQWLREQRVQERKTQLLSNLKQQEVFESLIRPPLGPVVQIATEGFPSKGNAAAPVTIVEFSDFQCPHCKRAANVIRELMGQYADRVRLVYMDLPINRSGVSRLVSEGAVCAQEQGQFWEYHDLAFARQASLDQDSPFELANAAGLDRETFRRCFESPQTKARVARSEAEARRLGLTSTPSVFVNGKRIQIYDLQRDLSNAVKEALAQGSS